MSAVILTSDSLIGTPASGNLEYNGQFYGTDSNASRAQMQRIVLGTVNSGGTNPFPGSGGPTSVTFGSLPSWIKRITVMFNGVSTSGSSNIQIQIGSGSTVITGYNSSASQLNTGSMSTSGSINSGFVLTYSTLLNSSLCSGHAVLTTLGSNNWIESGLLSRGDGCIFVSAGTSGALSGALDRVVITTVNGTDTFDAGSINIIYEG
jgi:hypothetical protein